MSERDSISTAPEIPGGSGDRERHESVHGETFGLGDQGLGFVLGQIEPRSQATLRRTCQSRGSS